MKQLVNLMDFKRNAINTAFVYTTMLLLVIFSLSSCNNPKTEDSKDMAEKSNTAQNESADKEKDAQFLVDAAEINLEEIKCGKFAEQNAMSADTRDLGKMMVTEHTKCLSDLKALADKKSIMIPAVISTKGEEDYEKLIDRAGADFDKNYCDMMVDGHKGAIAKFEKESIDGSDPDIRAWASETLPALRKHLDHFLNCQKSCAKL
jgi:putative membrane protein